MTIFFTKVDPCFESKAILNNPCALICERIEPCETIGAAAYLSSHECYEVNRDSKQLHPNTPNIAQNFVT